MKCMPLGRSSEQAPRFYQSDQGILNRTSDPWPSMHMRAVKAERNAKMYMGALSRQDTLLCSLSSLVKLSSFSSMSCHR